MALDSSSQAVHCAHMRCTIYPLSNATEQVGLPRWNKWALGQVGEDGSVSFHSAARTKRELTQKAADKGWEVVSIKTRTEVTR